MNGGARFLAADLGASGGRIMVCTWTGERFVLEELHRFPNVPVQVADELCWNALGLWRHLLDGLTKYVNRYGESPCGMAVDAWGVDFALLDQRGHLIAGPLHYRDPGNCGVIPELFARISEREWYQETGTHSMEMNTLFRLYRMGAKNDPRLAIASKMLLVPDLFLHFLCGEAAAEFTGATTTQMYSLKRRAWAGNLLRRAGIPDSILPPVVCPGTLMGRVRYCVMEECGAKRPFPVMAVASHDTAGAVACIPELDANSVFISCGTWSLIGVHSPTPDTSDRAMELGFTNEGAADGGVLLLKNLTGLWILQECLRVWEMQGQQIDWNLACQAASAASPFRACVDCDDPRLHTLTEMPEAICTYLRATEQPMLETMGEMVRSILESLALKFRLVVEWLESLTGRQLTTIRIVGGGCRNHLLCQMAADATNRTVVAGPAEASALGNGLLQAIAVGYVADLASGRAAVAASLERVTYTPNERSLWDEAFGRFQRLRIEMRNCE